MPAAAVIQTVRALFGINGRKGYVGSFKKPSLKCWSNNLSVGFETGKTRVNYV